MIDNNENRSMPVDMDNFNPDHHTNTGSSLMFHVYNEKRLKAFKMIYNSFLKIIMYTGITGWE
jgi:hypothetical protein